MKDKKVLIVITSHNTLNDGKQTGYWLGEVTHFYHILKEAGYEVDFTSPKGSQPPLDQRSYDLRDKDNRQFWEDKRLHSQLNNTIPIEAVNAEDYIAIYYAGGHGAMWDFPSNERLAQLAAQIYEKGGFVCAVCHGSAGLLNIKLANGRSLLDGKTGISKPDPPRQTSFCRPPLAGKNRFTAIASITEPYTGLSVCGSHD